MDQHHVHVFPRAPGRRRLAFAAASLLVLTLMTTGPALAQDAATQDAPEQAHNPIIWADVPDPSVIRVGDTYWMSSTTMHMCPGLPIMKSKDLVNWELSSYAYDRLGDNDAVNLDNGENMYSRGTWASSMRHHDGLFVVSTFSFTTGLNYVFTTDDPDSGEWKRHEFGPVMHDHSLFFDDDGRVYMIYGGTDIRIREIEPDFSGVKERGVDRMLIEDVGSPAGDNLMLGGEGSQLRKIDGKYYLMNITWPRGGMRTVIVHRADSLDGPWEGRVALQDKGVAQGSLVDTPEGDWYATLFRDYGAVGRIPYLVPVSWEDGWPVFGVDGEVPMTLDLPANGQGASGVGGIVSSDDFERSESDSKLPLAWQFNHQPDGNWSLDERPGYFRIRTSRVDENVEQARNTLTQRTFGPASTASTTLDTSGMKPGDVAGLICLMADYGYVGVEATEQGKDLVMVRAEDRRPVELERVPLDQETVQLRIDCDFQNRADTATFSYSLDGESWTPIGEPVQLRYTLVHFMGARFGLFNYATETAGGHADFDDFHIGESRRFGTAARAGD